MTTHTDREGLEKKISSVFYDIVTLYIHDHFIRIILTLIQEVCEEVIGENDTLMRPETLDKDFLALSNRNRLRDEQRSRMMELLKVDSNGGEK